MKFETLLGFLWGMQGNLVESSLDYVYLLSIVKNSAFQTGPAFPQVLCTIDLKKGIGQVRRDNEKKKKKT